MNEEQSLQSVADQLELEELNDDSWGVSQVWTKALERPDARAMEPRDYLWASELGKSYLDVFLRMKGTEQTNPPNGRSMRKFEAGNLWEWMVMQILKRSGLFIEEQRRVEHQYDGMLRVSGKIDFIAGGKPDYEKAKAELEEMDLPPRTLEAMEFVIKHLTEKYPDGLAVKALEVKSISSFMMNALEITERPLAIHRLQAYHYTKAEGIDRADIVYICRDDCRMIEFPIMADDPEIEAEYKGWIGDMTNYWLNDAEPPKAEPIVFDVDQGKFSINRQIGWSGYLTLVYGFEDQMAFEEKYGKYPASWNRVLKRIKNEENLTKNNLEKIAEMEEHGFDAHELSKLLVDAPEEDGNSSDAT